MKHLFLLLLFCCGTGLTLMASPAQMMDENTGSERDAAVQAITDSSNGTQNVRFFTKEELRERKTDISVIKKIQRRNQLSPLMNEIINFRSVSYICRPKPHRPPVHSCGLIGPVQVSASFEGGSKRDVLFTVPASRYGRLTDR